MRVLGIKGLTFVMVIMLSGLLLPLSKAYASFPIGLVLKYHVTDDLQGEWDEQFTIHQVIPVQEESLFLIEFSSTNENHIEGMMLLNRSTWHFTLANGTVIERPLQPPFLVNTSNWQLGKPTALPTYTGSFLLSSSYLSLEFGTYLCWRIQSIAWISIDDDYQQCNENWYYHYAEGVLLKYTYEILASQHAIFTYRIRRELTGGNFQTFGIFSIEDLVTSVLCWLGTGLVVLLLFLGVVFALRLHRTKRFNIKPK
jgi:hypothetical protein